MTNVTVGHYSEEEFAKVTPENKGNRTPRWEAEPNYGLPRPAPRAGAPPAPLRGGINFPGGEGRRKLAEGLEGLPIVKPPYGVLAAIDLKNPDKLLFQVPHGDTPDAIKNHPLLKGMNIPKTGQSGSVGVLITKNFVAVGRSRHHDRQRRARRVAARLRQDDRRADRRSARAGADRRHADDLLGQRPPVHRRRRQRRQLHGRIHRLPRCRRASCRARTPRASNTRARRSLSHSKGRTRKGPSLFLLFYTFSMRQLSSAIECRIA